MLLKRKYYGMQNDGTALSVVSFCTSTWLLQEGHSPGSLLACTWSLSTIENGITSVS